MNRITLDQWENDIKPNLVEGCTLNWYYDHRDMTPYATGVFKMYPDTQELRLYFSKRDMTHAWDALTLIHRFLDQVDNFCYPDGKTMLGSPGPDKLNPIQRRTRDLERRFKAKLLPKTKMKPLPFPKGVPT